MCCGFPGRATELFGIDPQLLADQGVEGGLLVGDQLLDKRFRQVRGQPFRLVGHRQFFLLFFEHVVELVSHGGDVALG